MIVIMAAGALCDYDTKTGDGKSDWTASAVLPVWITRVYKKRLQDTILKKKKKKRHKALERQAENHVMVNMSR